MITAWLTRAESPADTIAAPKAPKKPKASAKSGMDFASYETRFVALQLLYLGHAYDGFARQESSPDTIEARLFAALERTRLLPPGAPWQAIRYSRGGRTDRGVSARGQVVAMDLRSAARAGGALPGPEAELDYPALLNRVLPDDIRVTGWCDPRSPDFSARFSASHRDYTYTFVSGPGEVLDVAAMREAGSAFLGTHDFRNFCKVARLCVEGGERGFASKQRRLLSAHRRVILLTTTPPHARDRWT